jgi:hypothetical protein
MPRLTNKTTNSNEITLFLIEITPFLENTECSTNTTDEKYNGLGKDLSLMFVWRILHWSGLTKPMCRKYFWLNENKCVFLQSLSRAKAVSRKSIAIVAHNLMPFLIV